MVVLSADSSNQAFGPEEKPDSFTIDHIDLVKNRLKQLGIDSDGETMEFSGQQRFLRISGPLNQGDDNKLNLTLRGSGFDYINTDARDRYSVRFPVGPRLNDWMTKVGVEAENN